MPEILRCPDCGQPIVEEHTCTEGAKLFEGKKHGLWFDESATDFGDAIVSGEATAEDIGSKPELSQDVASNERNFKFMGYFDTSKQWGEEVARLRRLHEEKSRE